MGGPPLFNIALELSTSLTVRRYFALLNKEGLSYFLGRAIDYPENKPLA